MMPEDESIEPEDSVEDVFTAFREAWYAGERPDPEAFLKIHPTFGGALRERIENFLMVAGAFPDPGADEDNKVCQSETDGDKEERKTIGEFRILREIGRGGMGIVYEAEQISLNRPVALKVLSPHLGFSSVAVDKFYREAMAGGRQRHTGIVSVYGVGEHEGTHYIAQEFIKGSYTLADKLEGLRKEKDLPLGYFRKAADYIVRVAEALQHAHASGVIHRDVKPANILLAEEDQPKVTDFGLAKVEDALALSRTGDLAGTPYYMSPEQALSRRIEIDHRTDIYSLGVTLYEMLTLQRPFEGRTSQEILKKIISLEPSDPRKVNPRVPRDLSVICLKAIEKEPKHRYQTMQEFGNDLRRFLQGEVILARPTRFPAKAWKRVKRNPVLSGAVGVAVLAVLALILSIPFYIVQLSSEKKKAESEAEKAQVIHRFIERMLASADPRVRGKDLKVVEVLDRASEELDESFPDRPEIEASLRRTLGMTYHGLGMYEKALVQQEIALEINRRLWGEENRKTLQSMGDLATTLYIQKKASEAAPIFRKALETTIRIRGEEHYDTFFYMTYLASALGKEHKFSKAEPLLRRAVNGFRRTRGEEDVNTLWAMGCLAEMIIDKYGMSQADFSEAESLHRKVLESRQRILGERNSYTIDSMVGLATAKERQGKFAEAERHFRRAFELQREIEGKEHPRTLKTMGDLAHATGRQGKVEEAESLFGELLGIQSRLFGDEHWDTLDARFKRARVLLENNRLAEAESCYREILEVQLRVLGEEDVRTLNSMNNLAATLARRNRYPEAEPLYRKVLEARIRILGKESLETIHTMYSLATVLAVRGKLPEAEPLARESMEGLRTAMGVEHRQTFEAMHNTTLILIGLGKFSDAEQILREILEVRRGTKGEGDPATLDAMNSLADCFMAGGKLSEAEELLVEGLEIAKKSLPPDHATTAMLGGTYGEFLIKQKRYEEAEPHLLAAYAVFESSDPYPARTVLQILVRLYDAWGKPEKAAEYRARLR